MIPANIPGFIVRPFAESGGKSTIPVTTASPGRASLTEGFPALTRTPIASGGIPPDGTDMNGILFDVSGWARWSGIGGPVPFDAAMASAIGGYPQGSILASNAFDNLWFCMLSNNSNNPNTGGTNWTNVLPTVTAVTATTSLTVRQKGAVLVDATAGDITITLPFGASALSLPIVYQFIRTDSSANIVTIVRAGGNTIEGLASITLGVGQRMVLNSAGAANWRVVSTTGSSGMQSFTSSGTFTVPSGVYRIKVICTGGGGGGGGCAAGQGAGGGGAGGTAIEWISVVPGASVTVTVGAAGTPGGSGGSPAGGSGGTSSFGAYCSATGGGGGDVTSGGGIGGTATGGAVNLSGGDGGDGSFLTDTYGGTGGASFWGGGARGGVSSGGGGLAAKAPGSGGGGAYARGTGASAGGVGSAGLVTVEWN